MTVSKLFKLSILFILKAVLRSKSSKSIRSTMKAKIIKPREGPEAEIQRKIVIFLKRRGWYVLVTHGNSYQSGLPDLYICHKKYGTRWVEVKNPLAFRFTNAQMEVFPALCDNGSGVWILVADTNEEYLKLFKPSNWHLYLIDRKHGIY